MVLVLLPPFCLHSKTHFKTCFKKMLMHWNFLQGGHGIIDFWSLKLFFFLNWFLILKLIFYGFLYQRIFQTVVSVYIQFNLMNVRYVDPTIRFLLIPSQGYSNWISKMYIPLSLHNYQINFLEEVCSISNSISTFTHIYKDGYKYLNALSVFHANCRWIRWQTTGTTLQQAVYRIGTTTWL